MLVQRVRREQVAVDGISNVELHVLTVIGAASHPLRPGQLCDELHMTTPNMAATLRKLETLRLIVRKQDPTDGRQRLVLATETGRRLVEETRAVRHAWLGDAMDRLLTESEKQVLVHAGELMQRLAEDPVTRPRMQRAGRIRIGGRNTCEGDGLGHEQAGRR